MENSRALVSEIDTTSEKQYYVQKALAELQITAANFATMCINDAEVRRQYTHDTASAAAEIRLAVQSGRLSPKDAAELANKMRNELLELSRGRSSPAARAYAMQLKKDGLPMGKLAERYAQRMFGKSFASLSESQQAGVYTEIVNAAGRGNQAVAAFAKALGKAGQRLLIVSVAVAIYEIWESEDKTREAARQGSLAAAGIAGGWAVGAGVVAVGVCAATAPICVGVAALIGGMLFAAGTDLAFNTMYPVPTRH